MRRRSIAALAAVIAVATTSSAWAFGTLRPPLSYPAGSDATAAVAADFNHDGSVDLAVSSGRIDPVGSVVVFRGNGDGTLKAPIKTQVAGGAGGIAKADFNRDGDPDLAVADGPAGKVSVLLGKAGATFGAARAYAVDDFPGEVAAADFNRDGRTDLASANSNGRSVSILLAKRGGFRKATDISFTDFAERLTISDFNRDGRPDLVVVLGQFGGRVAILRGRAGGHFTAPQKLAAGTAPTDVAVADLNHDGRRDLAVSDLYPDAHGNNIINVLYGKRRGRFRAPRPFIVGTAGDQPFSIAATDLNLDRRRDLLVANPEFSGPGEVAVLLAKPGGFRKRVYYDAGDSPFFVTSARLNHDRAPDVVAVDAQSDDVSVLVNKR